MIVRILLAAVFLLALQDYAAAQKDRMKLGEQLDVKVKRAKATTVPAVPGEPLDIKVKKAQEQKAQKETK